MCRLEVRWMRAGQGCAREDERADLAMEMSSLSSSTSWRVATTVRGMMASRALTWRSASLNLPSVTLRYIPFSRSSSVLSVYGCTGKRILVPAPPPQIGYYNVNQKIVVHCCRCSADSWHATPQHPCPALIGRGAAHRQVLLTVCSGLLGIHGASKLRAVQAVCLARMSHIIRCGTSGARDTHQCWGAGRLALVSAARMLQGHGHNGCAGQRGHYCQRARVDLQEERLQRLKIANAQLPAGHGWSDAEDALALRKALMQQLTGYSLT